MGFSGRARTGGAIFPEQVVDADAQGRGQLPDHGGRNLRLAALEALHLLVGDARAPGDLRQRRAELAPPPADPLSDRPRDRVASLAHGRLERAQLEAFPIEGQNRGRGWRGGARRERHGANSQLAAMADARLSADLSVRTIEIRLSVTVRCAEVKIPGWGE